VGKHREKPLWDTVMDGGYDGCLEIPLIHTSDPRKRKRRPSSFRPSLIKRTQN